jgi:hypothetical protein
MICQTLLGKLKISLFEGGVLKMGFNENKTLIVVTRWGFFFSPPFSKNTTTPPFSKGGLGGFEPP